MSAAFLGNQEVLHSFGSVTLVGRADIHLHPLWMLGAVKAKIGQDFRRGMKTGVASGSLGLSRDPPLKLGRNLVEPLFRLFRSISIDLNLDLQLSNAIR